MLYLVYLEHNEWQKYWRKDEHTTNNAIIYIHNEIFRILEKEINKHVFYMSWKLWVLGEFNLNVQRNMHYWTSELRLRRYQYSGLRNPHFAAHEGGFDTRTPHLKYGEGSRNFSSVYSKMYDFCRVFLCHPLIWNQLGFYHPHLKIKSETTALSTTIIFELCCLNAICSINV